MDHEAWPGGFDHSTTNCIMYTVRVVQNNPWLERPRGDLSPRVGLVFDLSALRLLTDTSDLLRASWPLCCSPWLLMRVKLLSSVFRANLNFVFGGVTSLSVAEICITSWNVRDGKWSVWFWGSILGCKGGFRHDHGCLSPAALSWMVFPKPLCLLLSCSHLSLTWSSDTSRSLNSPSVKCD